ncbi:glycoside hydrolase family protein [Candidatus Bathyarchaeota archaeon]|nr:glycoside hydrolase family protein [Candidatus Bathyarchaeota archaeon]
MHLSHTLALAALATTSLAVAIDRRAAPGTDECVTTVVTTTTTVTVTVTKGHDQRTPDPKPTAETPEAVTAQGSEETKSPDAKTPKNEEDKTPRDSSSSAGPKRGFVYNDASLVDGLIEGPKAQGSWAYNWGQTNGGLTSNIEFVPMLWGNKDGMYSSWKDNANEALTKGTTHLLSFNEPDMPSPQANMSPEDAAAAHAEHMSFGENVKIGSPGISNSDKANQGTKWLEKFMSACKGCQIDFCVAHWYGPPKVEHLKKHLDDVHGIPGCEGKPVWLTEFAPLASGEEAATFVKKAMEMMDGLDWLERYSYFMVGGEGRLTEGAGLSVEGQAYFEINI